MWIVHDYLTQRGGAERVALALTRAFPGAPLLTSLYEPASTFPEFDDVDVRTLPIDRVTFFRRNARAALPVLAPTFASRRLDTDVVVCSSSGWAHLVRTAGRKIVYCHSPAKNSNHNEFWSLLKQTRQQPIARKASWISWRRS